MMTVVEADRRVDARACSYLSADRRPAEIDDKAICRAFTRRINAICMVVCFERFSGLRGTSQYIRFRL